MIIAYLVVLFIAMLITELLRVLKFKSYMLVGFLIFLILAGAIGLYGKLESVDGPTSAYLGTPELQH